MMVATSMGQHSGGCPPPLCCKEFGKRVPYEPVELKIQLNCTAQVQICGCCLNSLKMHIKSLILCVHMAMQNVYNMTNFLIRNKLAHKRAIYHG